MKKCLHTCTPETKRPHNGVKSFPVTITVSWGPCLSPPGRRGNRSVYNPFRSDCRGLVALTSYTHDMFIHIKAQIKLNYWIEQNGFVVSAIDLVHVTVFKLVLLLRTVSLSFLAANLC